MFRLVSGLALLVIGPMIAFVGLIRLGFGRHGAPWYDLSYFTNALTAAHVENLITFAVGLACMLAGGWLVVRSVWARR
jgi:hypothetical protein